MIPSWTHDHRQASRRKCRRSTAQVKRRADPHKTRWREVTPTVSGVGSGRDDLLSGAEQGYVELSTMTVCLASPSA